jgi:hypothetical protein
MRVQIAMARFMLGGTETYSVTVAEQLERLGHTVTVSAAEASPAGRELAASRGISLSVGEAAMLGQVDAALVQDAASAYMLADRRPDLPQVFVTHGLAAYECPPDQLGGSLAVVALNDRIARHLGALASRPRVVRMHQPIDLERFRPRGASRPAARRILLLSNYLNGARLRILEEVCRDLDLELTRVGGSASPTIDPHAAIADADIVVGYGRSALEAMAMGRAAYVWGIGGGDGWVTPESYPAIEADGFSGAATDTVIDADRLRHDLAAYRSELGVFGFDLVRMHHSAAKHAEGLVDLLERASAPTSADALETLARLVRLECRAAIRVDRLEAENGHMRDGLEEMRARSIAAEAALSTAESAASAERVRRIEGEELLDAVMRSRSWRLGAPMRRAAAYWRNRRLRF